ncbi:MAG: hypothetical protein R3F20_18945 [Planctomycetota bacterium]
MTRRIARPFAGCSSGSGAAGDRVDDRDASAGGGLDAALERFFALPASEGLDALDPRTAVVEVFTDWFALDYRSVSGAPTLAEQCPRRAFLGPVTRELLEARLAAPLRLLAVRAVAKEGRASFLDLETEEILTVRDPRLRAEPPRPGQRLLGRLVPHGPFTFLEATSPFLAGDDLLRDVLAGRAAPGRPWLLGREARVSRALLAREGRLDLPDD